MEKTLAYNAKLDDGFRSNTNGYCKDVVVKLDKHTIKEKFYLFELEGVDIILRVA